MQATKDLIFVSLLRGWQNHLQAVVIIGFLTVVVVEAYRCLTSPLQKYSGPKLAAWTNLYRFYLVLTDEYHIRLAKLHEKYGPVVRLGPNTLDLDYPELSKILYGTDNKWIKTDFYHSNSNKINGQIRYTIFSTPNRDEHRALRRPIAKHYTPGAVLGLEPLVDQGIRDMCHQIERRFVDGPPGVQACDLGAWIAYLTWDIVGTTTFSKPFGYLEKGCDFDGSIKIADQSQAYFSAVGQMPFLGSLLDKNPVMRIGPPNLGNALRIALQRVALREQGKDTSFNPDVPDYLKYFLDIRTREPEFVDDGVMVSFVFINLIAGADTIATTIRAAIYYILITPRVHERLKKEVRSANLGEIAQYGSVKTLPYLDAILRESMRLHPGVAMMLERYVPAEGFTLPDGSFVPPDTKVGLNPYIVHRNKRVYGEDADVFRPERWLPDDGEDDQSFQERVKSYARNDLTFGAGTRICLGRHLSMFEAYKIVATLINHYDLEIENHGRDYKTINRWFFRQEGLRCKVSIRSPGT